MGRRKAHVPRGYVHSGPETRGRMELPYLHGLDGLVGILHGAEIVVNGLVRQQQLVEDLQWPGPVANRFQRHDRTTSWDRERIRRGSPDTLSPALSHTFLHTHTRFSPLQYDEVTAAWLWAVPGTVAEGSAGCGREGAGGAGAKRRSAVLRVDEAETEKTEKLQPFTHTVTAKQGGRRNHVFTRAGSPRLSGHAHPTLAGDLNFYPSASVRGCTTPSHPFLLLSGEFSHSDALLA